MPGIARLPACPPACLPARPPACLPVQQAPAHACCYPCACILLCLRRLISAVTLEPAYSFPCSLKEEVDELRRSLELKEHNLKVSRSLAAGKEQVRGRGKDDAEVGRRVEG